MDEFSDLKEAMYRPKCYIVQSAQTDGNGSGAGHRKAVAYVRYLNDEEVVSASTDSTLRLWNVNKPHAVRVYEGHVNEKNFVGLCADGEFIACGSELNEVCVGLCLRVGSSARALLDCILLIIHMPKVTAR